MTKTMKVYLVSYFLIVAAALCFACRALAARCTGATGTVSHTFAPYIDMGLTNSQTLLTIQQQSGIKVFSLAFIVDNGSCQAAWGGLAQTLPNDSTACHGSWRYLPWSASSRPSRSSGRSI
jgi:hypothetical protein